MIDPSDLLEGRCECGKVPDRYGRCAGNDDGFHPSMSDCDD